MAATTGSRNGLFREWGLGAQNWGEENDRNLKALDRFLCQLSVKSRASGTPPGSPAAGDSYIVGGSPTGAWAGHATHVAVYEGAAWVFGTPRNGWLAFIEDEAKLAAFNAGAWTSGVAL